MLEFKFIERGLLRLPQHSWFTTTWQGGHIGGQYNIIFSRRIFMKPEISSQRREMLLLLTTNVVAATSHANQQYPIVLLVINNRRIPLFSLKVYVSRLANHFFRVCHFVINSDISTAYHRSCLFWRWRWFAGLLVASWLLIIVTWVKNLTHTWRVSILSILWHYSCKKLLPSAVVPISCFVV